MKQGYLTNWTLHDSKDSVEYELPPFSIMLLRNANDFVPPKYQKTFQLELMYEDKTYTIEQENPIEVLESLAWHIHRCDPDIIVTDYGDSILLPKITQLAKQYKINMSLNRDVFGGIQDFKRNELCAIRKSDA